MNTVKEDKKNEDSPDDKPSDDNKPSEDSNKQTDDNEKNSNLKQETVAAKPMEKPKLKKGG